MNFCLGACQSGVLPLQMLDHHWQAPGIRRGPELTAAGFGCGRRLVANLGTNVSIGRMLIIDVETAWRSFHSVKGGLPILHITALASIPEETRVLDLISLWAQFATAVAHSRGPWCRHVQTKQSFRYGHAREFEDVVLDFFVGEKAGQRLGVGTVSGCVHGVHVEFMAAGHGATLEFWSEGGAPVDVEECHIWMAVMIASFFLIVSHTPCPQLAPSNNLVGANPDSAKFKYGSRSVAMSTCPRDVIANQPDLEGFPKGACSPGPQRYNIDKVPPCIRLSHAPEVDKIPPSYTMRLKTKILENTSQTGPKVGPGVYPAPDACGTQASSERPSKPLWTLHQNDRFPRKLDKPDTSRLWDGSGDKKVQFSRCFSSPGSFSFGTSTRFHASKVALALTPLDKGPAGDMGHHRPAQPSIASRRDILRYTDIPSG
ncbi:unnamed protein product [Polarella glacialis]|uniref:Uncharacterized protein n=1 Tax=Polarella glacialis TaxID=89957 RepID=A0A813FWC3_POLGL|nr:unnamed protein product [Polarella glacialis]